MFRDVLSPPLTPKLGGNSRYPVDHQAAPRNTHYQGKWRTHGGDRNQPPLARRPTIVLTERPWATGAFLAILFVVASACSSSNGTPRSSTTATTSASAATSTTTARAVRAPALRCPSTPPVAPPVQLPTTETMFVPGTPTELLACRYHGFNQPQRAYSLARAARLAPAPITAALNAARPIPPGAVFNCPNDSGETIVLLFGYANGRTLQVTVSMSGCEFAHNGRRTVAMPPALLARLQTVLGHDRP